MTAIDTMRRIAAETHPDFDDVRFVASALRDHLEAHERAATTGTTAIRVTSYCDHAGIGKPGCKTCDPLWERHAGIRADIEAGRDPYVPKPTTSGEAFAKRLNEWELLIGGNVVELPSTAGEGKADGTRDLASRINAAHEAAVERAVAFQRCVARGGWRRRDDFAQRYRCYATNFAVAVEAPTRLKGTSLTRPLRLLRTSIAASGLRASAPSPPRRAKGSG